MGLPAPTIREAAATASRSLTYAMGARYGCEALPWMIVRLLHCQAIDTQCVGLATTSEPSSGQDRDASHGRGEAQTMRKEGRQAFH